MRRLAYGAAAFLVAILVDGYGHPFFAERWMAAALWRSGAYPRPFAAVGAVGAAMCLAYALSDVLGVRLPLPLWPWGPAVVALWRTLLGALMLRKEPVEARGTGPGPDIHSAGT